MRNLVCRLLLPVLLISLAAGSAAALEEEQEAGEEKEMPKWEEVEEVFVAYFARGQFHPDDLVAQDVVKPLFVALERIGWKVRDRDEILKRVLPADDFLVQALRTKEGLKFMRQSSRFPGTYDRLDHLRGLPHGEQTIKDLIRGPDGYKLLRYMTTTRGGRNLGKQLSRAPKGKGFNKPTGRIYTVGDLYRALNRSYKDEKGRTEPVKETSERP